MQEISMSTEIKVPFTRPSINEEEEKAVLEVIRSGWLTTGKVNLAFEKEFSDFMNSRLKEKNVMSLAVNSNTSGMILAMHACGVKPGTAVITTPYTFVSTAACAKHLGADVIFCDLIILIQIKFKKFLKKMRNPENIILKLSFLFILQERYVI